VKHVWTESHWVQLLCSEYSHVLGFYRLNKQRFPTLGLYLKFGFYRVRFRQVSLYSVCKNVFMLQVLGIVLLVAGSLLKFKEDLVNVHVSKLLMQIQLENLAGNIHSIISTAAILCIVVGVFIFLLSMVGCCGACFQNRVLLVVVSVM